MKKFLSCALLIAVLTLCVGALAEVPALSDDLFGYAKKTLSALASGAYDKIVTKLPFSGVSPSANEWENFANGNFSALSGDSPQQKYAVAYWTGTVWKIAVPVAEPSSDDVETLVLISEDGQTFIGYGCASWGGVVSEYGVSQYVSWNKEYNGSTSAVVEMDDD